MRLGRIASSLLIERHVYNTTYFIIM